MKIYESMVLLDNREVKKGWEATREMVKSIFTKHGAEIISAKRWDERKLAYEIKKQKRGTYMLCYVKLESARISDLRRELELTEPVLRYAIVQVETIPPEAFEPEREIVEPKPGGAEGEAPGAAEEAPGAKDSGAGEVGEKPRNENRKEHDNG